MILQLGYDFGAGSAYANSVFQDGFYQLDLTAGFDVTDALYLGLNTNGFKVEYKPSVFANAEIEVESEVGFNVGLIADLKLHNNINLRFEPGLISNTKVLRFKHVTAGQDVREVGNTYLHLPFIFKFSSYFLNSKR